LLKALPVGFSKFGLVSAVSDGHSTLFSKIGKRAGERKAWDNRAQSPVAYGSPEVTETFELKLKHANEGAPKASGETRTLLLNTSIHESKYESLSSPNLDSPLSLRDSALSKKRK
jgi:hypothetical protein